MATLCTTALLLGAPRSQQNVPSTASASANTPPIYFPKGTLDRFAEFYSSYLSSIREPSLLTAAQETNTVSYRLICMPPKPILLVIRLSLNPDGGARITSTSASLSLSGAPTVGDRTQKIVTAAEVDQFLRLLEKANFWSMPADEQEAPDPPRPIYKVHTIRWVLEGARNGSYHVVFREEPEQSPFTDAVRFLAKDLAKLDNSSVPRPYGSTKMANDAKKQGP